MKKMQINIKGFTFNVTTRSETLLGVEYIVAPVNMIVEGVLPGSSGPVLYPAEELANSVNFWNNIPVTINHPAIDGNYVSARTPEIMDQFAVGYVFNTYFDSATNTLKAEAWIERQRLQDDFESVYNMLMSGNANIEISTGVLHYDDGQPGEFNGVSYNATGSDFYGDHLALLPNDTGACSWTDGCGLRANSKKTDSEKVRNTVFNQLDYASITDALWRYVDSMDDNQYIYYVHAVFSDYFVYRQNNRDSGERKLYKQNYSTANDVISPEGDAIRVKETRSFVPVPEGAPESSGVTTNNSNEGDEMAKNEPCCPEKVKSLIGANNRFTQDDEAWLLALDEKGLESVEAMAAEVTTNANANSTEEDIQMTARDYAEAAPEGLKDYFNALLDQEEAKKEKLVTDLSANENCLFSKEELEGFSVNQLEKMSGLSASEETSEGNTGMQADMGANAPLSASANADEGKGDTLEIPTVNWGKK